MGKNFPVSLSQIILATFFVASFLFLILVGISVTNFAANPVSSGVIAKPKTGHLSLSKNDDKIASLSSPLKPHNNIVSSKTNNNSSLTGFCLDVPVLLYHHIEPLAQAKSEGHASLAVDPTIFDQQMQYLISHGYQTITADQLADSLISHTGLGTKNVVLTFDDGYEDIYTYAYPIFQKYHLMANLMIPAGLLENPDYLKWSQLKEMVNSGLVNAYDHTWSHASLGNASEQKIQFEVLTSKKELEQNLGRPVNVFVYPYGSYNLRVENILRGDGFRAAFSTIPGFWQCDSFILNLHRTRIGNAPLSYYGL